MAPSTPSQEINMTTLHPSPLLRAALIGDAIASGTMGLLLAAGASLLSPLLGLHEELLRGAGLLLIPYAAAVGYLSTRTDMRSGLVWSVIGLNLLWTIESLALLFTSVRPTALGYAFVIAQAAAVMVFAGMQFAGMRRAVRSKPQPLSGIA
jgi:hypothetical protein